MTKAGRPWFLIVFFSGIAAYLFYAVAFAAYYFWQQGQSLQLMQAYFGPFLIAVACMAIAIGMSLRASWVKAPAIWIKSGVGGFVTLSTWSWVAVALFIFAWTANALGSLALWALSGGIPVVGYALLATNALGLAVSSWLFLAKKRRAAVQSAVAVIPLTFLGFYLATLMDQQILRQAL